VVTLRAIAGESRAADNADGAHLCQEVALLSDEDGIKHPDFRATYTDGRLCLVTWNPWMPYADAPFARHLLIGTRVATVVCELTILRVEDEPKELIVTELANPGREDFRDAIVDWARLLHYGRVWLGFDLIELGPLDDRWDRTVTTACSCCRTVWSMDTFGFWGASRDAGAWPSVCRLCGALLPQWTVQPDPEPAQLRLPGIDAQ
jgi:hypothetical protein